MDSIPTRSPPRTPDATRKPNAKCGTRIQRSVAAPMLLVSAALAVGTWQAMEHFDTPIAVVLAAQAAIWILLVTFIVHRVAARPLWALADAMQRDDLGDGIWHLPDQRFAELQRLVLSINRILDRAGQSEAKTRAVLDGAADGIISINHRGTIQTFNPAAEKMFGHRADAVIGKNVSILMPDKHRRRHDSYLRRYLDSGVSRVLDFSREETALRANGTLFPISISVSEVQIGDEPPLFCGIIRDVTDNKRFQGEVLRYTTEIERTNLKLAQAMSEADASKAMAEAANQSKSEFLANMSHEIRTPMTAILGYAENLQSDDLSDKDQKIAVDTIRRNGDHLMTIINDILDLSKIEAGKMDVERISCSPIRLMSEVADLVRVRTDAKNLELRVEYDPPLPAQVRTDPTRLRQILLNLLGNAVKFTERGHVGMSVALDTEGDVPMLVFEISDTGIGMTAEQSKKLFQPFEQADTSTTRRFGGTGLGLNISRRLAEALGGTIEFDSIYAAGSVFRVTVATGPLEGVEMVGDPRKVLATRSRSKQQRRLPTTLKGRILLAEDGPDNQRLISHILKKAGAAVDIADNGEMATVMALDATKQGQPYDVILMDMQMPMKDGYQATAELRRGGYRQPIIALTAHAMAEDRERCLAAGCDDFASKPVDRKALVAMLASHLSG